MSFLHLLILYLRNRDGDEEGSGTFFSIVRLEIYSARSTLLLAFPEDGMNDVVDGSGRWAFLQRMCSVDDFLALADQVQIGMMNPAQWKLTPSPINIFELVFTVVDGGGQWFAPDFNPSSTSSTHKSKRRGKILVQWIELNFLLHRSLVVGVFNRAIQNY